MIDVKMSTNVKLGIISVMKPLFVSMKSVLTNVNVTLDMKKMEGNVMMLMNVSRIPVLKMQIASIQRVAMIVDVKMDLQNQMGFAKMLMNAPMQTFAEKIPNAPISKGRFNANVKEDTNCLTDLVRILTNALFRIHVEQIQNA